MTYQEILAESYTFRDVPLVNSSGKTVAVDREYGYDTKLIYMKTIESCRNLFPVGSESYGRLDKIMNENC